VIETNKSEAYTVLIKSKRRLISQLQSLILGSWSSAFLATTCYRSLSIVSLQ
jgi:hypothetical protein